MRGKNPTLFSKLPKGRAFRFAHEICQTAVILSINSWSETVILFFVA